MHLQKLSIAVAIALTTTVGNIGLNPNQAVAANFVSEPTHINFDELNEKVDVTFDPDGNLLKSLNSGLELDNLWSDYGLNMNSNRNELWLYNSNCISPNFKNNKGKIKTSVSKDGFTNKCTGGDEDLATGKGRYWDKKNNKWHKYKSDAQGQVLIIQDNDADVPDDLAGSGNKITFDFTDELGVNFHHIGMLDHDDKRKSTKFKFTFLDGTVKNFSFGHDDDLKDDGYVSLLSTDWKDNPLQGNNSLRKYDFNFEDVTKLEITLPGSGAVTDLNYTRKRRVPEPSSMLGLLVGAFGVVSVVKRGSGIRG